VDVSIEGVRVSVKGPRGELQGSFDPDLTIEQSDGVLQVSRPSDAPRHRSVHGLTRSLIANMVQGVTEGFTRSLEIRGVGYRAEQKGANLSLVVGFSQPVKFDAPAGVTLTVEMPTLIRVGGIDKQMVGEVAAQIRRIRPPEPYKGKGIRYVGERVRRKAGKAAASAG